MCRVIWVEDNGLGVWIRARFVEEERRGMTSGGSFDSIGSLKALWSFEKVCVGWN